MKGKGIKGKEMKGKEMKGNGGEPAREKRSVRDEGMRYLEYRARTAWEVETRLKEKEYTVDEIADCMEFLKECHFVDDGEYCRRYVEYALEKGRGPQRIRQELRRKGISGVLIDQELEEQVDSDTQRDIALAQARKALGAESTEGRAFSEKELARAARRLAGLGHNSSVVYDVLRQLRREE